MNNIKTIVQTLPVDSFENMLSQSLNQVNPDPVFVGHLKSRLNKKAEVEIEKPQYMAAYLVVAIGLCSGVLLIWILGQIFRIFRGFLRH